MWDRANEIYDDWYGRYTEILQRGDYDSEKITSDPAALAKMEENVRGAAILDADTRIMNELNALLKK